LVSFFTLGALISLNMSQFDFPRINFFGQAFINPGTANNNLLLPLVTYDPIQASVVLPPRIYLSPDLLALHKLGGLPIPEDHLIKYDNIQAPYVEIAPINNQEKYKTWMQTPLGKSPLDKHYHELYQIIRSKRTHKPLMGSVPASWNYYGGMEFDFEGVKVVSVALPDDQTGQRLLTLQDAECPSDVAAILGATIDMENERGKNSAVMIDILPSLAMFSQVFCDSFQMKKNGNTLLKGKPLKGSLRFLNQARVVNQEGVLGASGSFFSVIPVENLEEEKDAPILSFFQKYGQRDSPIQGVFIRYNLFEVKENQAIDYQTWGEKANPAFATVVGSITPWYKGDMKSIAMGRQMIPELPFLQQKRLASFVCQINTQMRTVSLDMLGSIPEQLVQQTPTPTYETYPLGKLTLKLLEEDSQEIEIGTFTVSPQHFSREELTLTGGIIELSFKDKPTLTTDALNNGRLVLYGRSDASKETVMLMKESEYMIASDQAGLYANQGQHGTRYVSYDSRKEPCYIRVYRRGQPLASSFPLTIMELKITGVGASASVKPFLITESFRDNQTLSFPTDQAANAMYVFYPEPPPVISEDLITEIYRTGFFVSLRVLPKKDFGKYLDPNHEEYPTPVTFETLYQELLQTSALIFPIAALITPFTEAYFKKGKEFIKRRMSPENWASATYMPSSRDMSADLWALFCKWLDSH
jgi:hypothetical protein